MLSGDARWKRKKEGGDVIVMSTFLYLIITSALLEEY